MSRICKVYSYSGPMQYQAWHFIPKYQTFKLRTRQLHYRKWYLMKFMLKQLLRSLSFFFFNRRHRKPPGRPNKPEIPLGIRPILALIQLQDQVSCELTLQTEQACHIRGCLLGPEHALSRELKKVIQEFWIVHQLSQNTVATGKNYHEYTRSTKINQDIL